MQTNKVSAFKKGFKESNPFDCWPWNGYKDKNGYGKCGSEWAHRLVYKKLVCLIPKGKLVLHKCDNPPCVNPAHLFLGTQKDNIQDMLSKGRYTPHGKKGMDNKKSKLTDIQVLEMRRIYHEEDITLKKLGIIFGVSFRTCWDIVTNKHWKHLKMYPLKKSL